MIFIAAPSALTPDSSPSPFSVSHLSLESVSVRSLMPWHVKRSWCCYERWHTAKNPWSSKAYLSPYTRPVKPTSFWMFVLTFLKDLIFGDAITSRSKELRCWPLNLWASLEMHIPGINRMYRGVLKLVPLIVHWLFLSARMKWSKSSQIQLYLYSCPHAESWNGF